VSSCLAAHCMLPAWRKSAAPAAPSIPMTPIVLATTIPKSLDRTLREHATATGKPRSEHLAAAIRAYVRKEKR
jgi:hypothetical protein